MPVRQRHPNFIVYAPGPRGAPRGPAAGVSAKPALDQAGAVDAEDTPRHARSAEPAAWPVPLSVEAGGVGAVLAAGFAAHAFNAFGFPRYELDEGTYMSSAWAILNGQVTPYPYGYAHPPFGWIQIAAWVQMTGGFFTFGNALNSGRVLMLLFAAGSACLVYLLARRLTGSPAAALLALTLFAFSPLSLDYQRQVYLDNIGVFWLLLSLYLLVVGRSRLAFVVAAGLAFGMAVLSKEVFALFLPVMVYAVWLYTSRYQRLFGLIAFTYCVAGMTAAFVLLAVLRGELFPYEWHLPGDVHPHLSLLDTWTQQVLRTQAEGRFADSWYTWTHADPVLIGAGIGAAAFNAVTGWWRRGNLMLALLSAVYWLFLVRGGIVLSFYVIALLPLVALNVAAAAGTIMTWAPRLARIEPMASLAVCGLAAAVMASGLTSASAAFTEQPTSAQNQTMVWIRGHVPRDSVIALNSYLYLDLRQPGGMGVGDGATYPFAHVYWNMAFDPELHDGMLDNNWDRVDYLVVDSEMLHDIRSVGGPMTLLDEAYRHSILVRQFRADENGRQLVISIYQVVHKAPPSLAGSGDG